MAVVRGQMWYTETFVFMFIPMVVILIIVPLIQHGFPTLVWLPYDPYASNSYYIVTFLWQSLCSIAVGITVISTNVYVYTVLICLSFNYILLGQRLQRIGCTNRKRSRTDVHGDLNDLIKLHLKMNQ